MRANHAFSAPFLIHPNPSPSFIIWSALAPAALGIALKFLIFDPYDKRKRVTKLRRLREHSASTLHDRRKEAEEAIDLMRESVMRRREIEEARHGLVIVEAWYGDLHDRHEVDSRLDTEFPSKIDVTLPLQSLVQNSQLHLHNTTKVSVHSLSFLIHTMEGYPSHVT
jgi:DnaJ homolog subfamily C member 11